MSFNSLLPTGGTKMHIAIYLGTLALAFAIYVFLIIKRYVKTLIALSVLVLALIMIISSEM